MKKGWLVFLVLLAAAALTLSGILLGKFSREEKIFQEHNPHRANVLFRRVPGCGRYIRLFQVL